MKHNHLTRDIKRPGVCPACDEYHRERLMERLDQARRARQRKDDDG